MKLDYEVPHPDYPTNMPPFDVSGKVTERVLKGLENVLAAYTDIVRMHAPKTSNNPANYAIEQVAVCGSGARNVPDSDLDLMIITPRLAPGDAQNINMILAMIFYTDRDKTQAIDAYVRERDWFPDRPSVDVTDQVEPMLRTYNTRILGGLGSRDNVPK